MKTSMILDSWWMCGDPRACFYLCPMKMADKAALWDIYKYAVLSFKIDNS